MADPTNIFDSLRFALELQRIFEKATWENAANERNVIALKGPLGTSKINALHAETFQSDTRVYNGLQTGCPI